MSNLLKYNRVIVKDDNKLVIDSNRIVQDMLAERLAREAETNYGKQAAEPDEDGFVCGLDAVTVEQLISEDVDVEQMEERNAILADADKKAEEVIAAAEAEADAIREEAKKQGYDDGIEEGRAYIDEVAAKKQEELEQKYNKRLSELEVEYNKKFEEIEPELTETLLELFSKVTMTIADDRKDIVFHLLERALKDVGDNKKFLIKVSDDDYTYVSSNKNKLMLVVSPDTEIEIIRDATMVKNQCVIESDAGVIDCSLDIQLDNLKKEIRLLSCLNRTDN